MFLSAQRFEVITTSVPRRSVSTFLCCPISRVTVGNDRGETRLGLTSGAQSAASAQGRCEPTALGAILLVTRGRSWRSWRSCEPRCTVQQHSRNPRARQQTRRTGNGSGPCVFRSGRHNGLSLSPPLCCRGRPRWRRGLSSSPPLCPGLSVSTLLYRFKCFHSPAGCVLCASDARAVPCVRAASRYSPWSNRRRRCAMHGMRSQCAVPRVHPTRHGY